MRCATTSRSLLVGSSTDPAKGTQATPRLRTSSAFKAALTATAEKNKMPGVRATEREMQADEIQRLKKENKAGKNGAYESLDKP